MKQTEVDELKEGLLAVFRRNVERDEKNLSYEQTYGTQAAQAAMALVKLETFAANYVPD